MNPWIPATSVRISTLRRYNGGPDPGATPQDERLMQEKRERLAAQEAEIALEELRLQRLRQRDEAERLQGPFARPARDTSRRRRDAEAARRVAEGLPDRGDETWVGRYS